MPRFNLDEYETVEQRIRKFYDENPDGRITTQNQTTELDRQVSTWVVYASVFLTAGDQANGLPKATGLAFEVDGGQGANQTAALENAETSAIGRALANAGYSGKKRPSREEMAKADRPRDFVGEADRIRDVESLRILYTQAKAAKASPEVLEKVRTRAELLGADSEDKGTGARVPASPDPKPKK
jgi:hypothetical protein